jgi:hypothetical protein
MIVLPLLAAAAAHHFYTVGFVVTNPVPPMIWFGFASLCLIAGYLVRRRA